MTANAPLAGTTTLVGILGWPVSHSLSPRMHNAAFAELGLDWAYVPLPVEPARVAEAVRGLVALGFVGANVTIPHKQAVVACCDAVDEVAARAGSVNTLLVRDGRVLGSSTDGLGATAGIDAVGRHVLLLGAGGAARPSATALLDAGAGGVTVAARRGDAAAELAERLRALYPDRAIATAAAWPPMEDADIVVNATPIKDDAIVPVRPDQQVVDLAYLPDGRRTALVEAARAAGCRTIVDGLEFLVRQGAASFETWTGRPAPVETMRAAVLGSREP
ncbi:MAG: shikimate dehydrogenase [Thermoleophilia bacterium]